MAKLDESIRQQVSRREVPLRVELAETEVTTLRPPPPVYLLVSRESFLPAVGKQVLEYFEHALPPGGHTPWFDAGGCPLKWQFPLGVLYDLHHPNVTSQPWRITVHFRDFPHSELLGCDEAALRSAFMNSMKEAAFALTGSASRVMSSHSLLEAAWEHMGKGNCAVFCQKVSEIDLRPSMNSNRNARIPVRVLINSPQAGAQWSWKFVTTISRPIDTQALGSAPESATLFDTLHFVAPTIFPDSAEWQHVDCEAAEEQRDSQPTRTDRSEACPKLSHFPPHVRVTVSGVEPLPSSPLIWLHECFKNMDNFLYIVVHVDQATQQTD